jgi:hypothetical protein
MINFKITLSLLIVAFVLSACFKKNNEQHDNSEGTVLELDSVVKALPNATLQAFTVFVETTDSTSDNMMLVVNRYKELFATESTLIADSGIIAFEKFYRRVEAQLNEKMMNDTTDYSVIWTGEPVPLKIKNFQKNLKDNGFRLASSEGMAYVLQDRSFVAKHLYDFISIEMKNYLMQIQKETDEGFADDAYITISPRQHVERIIWYENFIAQNAGFILIENCKNYHKAYLTYLFTGIDNSPLYENEETQQLNPYFETAYKLVLNKYAESELAKMIKPYYDALKAKDKNKARQILKDYHVKGYVLNF